MKECIVQLSDEQIHGFVVTTEEAIKMFSSGKCTSMDLSLTKIPSLKLILITDPITGETTINPVHHKRIKEIIYDWLFYLYF